MNVLNCLTLWVAELPSVKTATEFTGERDKTKIKIYFKLILFLTVVIL